MRIEIKKRHVLYAMNAAVWLKYGVIPDILRTVRHGLNAVTGAVNSVNQGVNEIMDGVSATTGNISYNAASVINSSDKGLIQIICTGLLVLFIASRIMPIVTNRGKSKPVGATKTVRGKKKPSGATKTVQGKTKPTKKEVYPQWYDEYGANFKNKADARKHFNEWYMWEYQQ